MEMGILFFKSVLISRYVRARRVHLDVENHEQIRVLKTPGSGMGVLRTRETHRRLCIVCEAHSAQGDTETWTLVQRFKQNGRPADVRNDVFKLVRIFKSGRKPKP